MHRFITHAAYLIRYWRRNAFVFGRNATPKKFLNFLVAEHAAKKRLVNVKAYPWEIFIDPSNICPLCCPLCLTGQRSAPRAKMTMSLDKFKQYTGPLLPYLYRLKLFNYGEPFTCTDIFGMISFASGKGVDVQVNSNLNVWHDGYAESCVKSGLSTLLVSLDGISQKAYASYRAGGDVEKVKRAIGELAQVKKQLRSKTPAIILQFLMQRNNEHEYDAVAAFAEKNSAHFSPQPITIDILDEQQRNEWLPRDEAKTHYDRVRLIKKKQRPDSGCGFLWNNPVINVDGGISPCCHVFYKSTDFGSLETDSFASIWNNEKFTAARLLQKKRECVSPTPIACSRCLNKRAFTDAQVDLINEYRSNLIQL